MENLNRKQNLNTIHIVFEITLVVILAMMIAGYPKPDDQQKDTIAKLSYGCGATQDETDVQLCFDICHLVGWDSELYMTCRHEFLEGRKNYDTQIRREPEGTERLPFGFGEDFSPEKKPV